MPYRCQRQWKSSLLRVISGDHRFYTGELTRASSLILSWVSQNTEHLHGTLAEYAANSGTDRTILQNIAHELGVSREDLSRDLASISEGQKKKVVLARSLCEPAHVYIWDEPFNYIDIYAKIQIEQMLADANAMMLFVEHDDAFWDAVGPREIALCPV